MLKDIIKGIKSLENKRMLFKGTTGGSLGSVLRIGLLLRKNVLTVLAKRVLIPLGLTAAASATDASIQKKIYESGITTMITSNKELKGITDIVK